MSAGLDPGACAYCGATECALEMDHFPIAQSYGGTEVVPVCVPCHDIVDRGGLDKLPSGLVDHGIAELSAKMPDDALYLQTIAAHTHMTWARWIEAVPGASWLELSPMAKLFLVSWTKKRSAHAGDEASMNALDLLRKRAKDRARR